MAEKDRWRRTVEKDWRRRTGGEGLTDCGGLVEERQKVKRQRKGLLPDLGSVFSFC